MTNLIIKLFINKNKLASEANIRTAYGTLAGFVGIICNIILFIAKLIIGLISGSVSITADAINNLSDASSSIVTYVGFRLASKPADKKHPYGHYRIEYFSGLVVSVLILVIGVELIKSSFVKIINPKAIEFSLALVIVLIVSILFKIWLLIFNTKISKIINSQTLVATAADSRNDVISTSAVLISCIIGKLTGLKIDGYAGFAIALFILWSGLQIAKDTINPLLGEAPNEDLVHTLSAEICKNDKVLGIHDLIMHDYGPGRQFASAHVEMDYKLDPLVAHEIIDNIEREIANNLNIELVIHYDPIVTDDAEIENLKSAIDSELKCLDSRFSLHDFRMVKGNTHTNVIFDMVIPYEYENRTQELKELVNRKIQFGDKKYYAVITFDTESFNDPHTQNAKN